MNINIILPNLTKSAPILNAIDIANFISETYEVRIFSLSTNFNKEVLNLINKKIILIFNNKIFFFTKIQFIKKYLKNTGGRKKNITISFTIRPDLTLSYLKDYSYTISSIRGNLKTNYKYSFGFFSYLVFMLHNYHLSNFDLLISISKSINQNLKELNFKNIYFIGNFINEKKFEKHRNKNTNKSSKLVFLYLGRFVRLKNIDEIVSLALKLKPLEKSIEFNLVGDGPLKPKIIKLIKKNNLENSVKVFNNKNDIHQFINESDYLLMPSLSEGVSRSILETLFLGTPVIARNIDSSNELIQENINGFLYSNFNDLHNLVIDIISNKKNINKKNYSLIPENFSNKKNTLRYLNLIKNIEDNRLDNFNNTYHNYLLSKSLKSYIYRNYFLYPKLSKHMKGKILDLGCGIGDLLKYNNKIIGIDINSDNIEYCKLLNLNAQIMKEDQIPFDSNFFDSLIMDNVLEHIYNPEIILSEIKRVLKNKGVLIIGVPGRKGYEYDNDHKRFYDINALNKILMKFAKINYFFYAPINSKIFDKILRQHCLYVICEIIKD